MHFYTPVTRFSVLGNSNGASCSWEQSGITNTEIDGVSANVWTELKWCILTGVYFIRAVEGEIPAVLHEMGAAHMTLATGFTDNCSKHFKCQSSTGRVCDSEIDVAG